MATSSAFLFGHGQENGKENGNGNGNGRGIDEGDNIQRSDGHEGAAVKRSDEHGGMRNANALEVNEKENEETSNVSIQRNGLSRGGKTVSDKPVHVSRIFVN